MVCQNRILSLNKEAAHHVRRASHQRESVLIAPNGRICTFATFARLVSECRC
jgi:hypothetical protein